MSLLLSYWEVLLQRNVQLKFSVRQTSTVIDEWSDSYYGRDKLLLINYDYEYLF